MCLYLKLALLCSEEVADLGQLLFQHTQEASALSVCSASNLSAAHAQAERRFLSPEIRLRERLTRYDKTQDRRGPSLYGLPQVGDKCRSQAEMKSSCVAEYPSWLEGNTCCTDVLLHCLLAGLVIQELVVPVTGSLRRQALSKLHSLRAVLAGGPLGGGSCSAPKLLQ